MAKKSIILSNVSDTKELAGKIDMAWSNLKASDIPIYDKNGYFSSANINDVLQEMRGASVYSFNTWVGAVVPAQDDYTWAQINKATSSIADITTRSHTALTDIGTNTHAQIDTHIGAAGNYLLLQPAGNVVINESGGDFDIRIETTGNANALILDAGANTIAHGVVTLLQDDVKITATKKLYLDGGGDTYIVESAGNVMDFYTAGNKAISIDALGRITKPLNPCFRAYATAMTNLTDNSSNILNMTNEDYDIGSNYNTTTKRFTAPVTGYYLFYGQIICTGGISTKRMSMVLRKNVDTSAVNLTWGALGNMIGDDGTGVTGFTSIHALTAGDVIQVDVYPEMGGSNTLDVLGGSVYTFWGGQLVQ